MAARARFPVAALDYFRQEGTRGGATAAKNMTPAARTARAKKAAAGRWKNRKKPPSP